MYAHINRTFLIFLSCTLFSATQCAHSELPVVDPHNTKFIVPDTGIVTCMFAGQLTTIDIGKINKFGHSIKQQVDSSGESHNFLIKSNQENVFVGYLTSFDKDKVLEYNKQHLDTLSFFTCKKLSGQEKERYELEFCTKSIFEKRPDLEQFVQSHTKSLNVSVPPFVPQQHNPHVPKHPSPPHWPHSQSSVAPLQPQHPHQAPYGQHYGHQSSPINPYGHYAAMANPYGQVMHRPMYPHQMPFPYSYQQMLPNIVQQPVQPAVVHHEPQAVNPDLIASKVTALEQQLAQQAKQIAELLALQKTATSTEATSLTTNTEADSLMSMLEASERKLELDQICLPDPLHLKEVIGKDTENEKQILCEGNLILTLAPVEGKEIPEESQTAQKDDSLIKQKKAARKEAKKIREAERKAAAAEQLKREEERKKIEADALKQKEDQKRAAQPEKSLKSTMVHVGNVLVKPLHTKPEKTSEKAQSSARSQSQKPSVQQPSAASSTSQKTRNKKNGKAPVDNDDALLAAAIAANQRAQSLVISEPTALSEDYIKSTKNALRLVEKKSLKEAEKIYNTLLKDYKTPNSAVGLAYCLRMQNRPVDGLNILTKFFSPEHFIDNAELEICFVTEVGQCVLLVPKNNLEDPMLTELFKKMKKLEDDSGKILFADIVYEFVTQEKHPEFKEFCKQTGPHDGPCSHSELRRIKDSLTFTSLEVAQACKNGWGGPVDQETALEIYCKACEQQETSVEVVLAAADLFLKNGRCKDGAKLLTKRIAQCEKSLTQDPRSTEEFQKHLEKRKLIHYRNVLYIENPEDDFTALQDLDPEIIHISNRLPTNQDKISFASCLWRKLKALQLKYPSWSTEGYKTLDPDEIALQESFLLLWNTFETLSHTMADLHTDENRMIHDSLSFIAYKLESEKPCLPIPVETLSDFEKTFDRSLQKSQTLLHFLFTRNSFRKMKLHCADRLALTQEPVEIRSLISYCKNLTKHEEYREMMTTQIKAYEKIPTEQLTNEDIFNCAQAHFNYARTVIAHPDVQKKYIDRALELLSSLKRTADCQFYIRSQIQQGYYLLDKDSLSKNECDGEDCQHVKLFNTVKTLCAQEHPAMVECLIIAMKEMYPPKPGCIFNFSDEDSKQLATVASQSSMQAALFNILVGSHKARTLRLTETQPTLESIKKELQDLIDQKISDSSAEFSHLAGLISAFLYFILESELSKDAQIVEFHGRLQLWAEFYHEFPDSLFEHFMKKEFCALNLHTGLIERITNDVRTSDQDIHLSCSYKTLQHVLNLFGSEITLEALDQFKKVLTERIATLGKSEKLTKKHLENMMSLIDHRLKK